MRKTQTTTPSSDESDAPKPRDRHGERSVPPPLAFDIYALPDSTLLTSRDVAAAGRCRHFSTVLSAQRPAILCSG